MNPSSNPSTATPQSNYCSGASFARILACLALAGGLGLGLSACGSPPAASLSADERAAWQGSSLQIQCGVAHVELGCTATDAEAPARARCSATRLDWQDASGQISTVAVPPELGDQRYPVALACLRAADGAAYVAVQYSALPTDCKYCEFFFAHDESGRLLTRSQPLILGSGADAAPNNQAFDALHRRMGQPALRWQYLF